MANARHPKAGRFVKQRLFAGLSAFGELEQRIADLSDEKSRGDAFEVFTEAYLATQRRHDAETVWPLTSVPIAILGSLQLAMQDYGVDGVLKTRLGKFSAYQVKFRTSRPALTWRELSTFMGLADSPNIHSRILLTNCDELPSVLNDRQGFFCIRGSDLDRLEAEDFKAIEAWLADSVYQAPKKAPLPHQTEALEKILPSFEEHNRVSAIMACGTGKTLVALWVAEKMQASRILVLVPSLALLRQILHEWLRETNLPSLAYLCVCSDATVKEGLDAIDTKQSDLDFQVSTDAASVRDFLDTPFTGAKIVFSTYQSAQVVGAALECGDLSPLSPLDDLSCGQGASSARRRLHSDGDKSPAKSGDKSPHSKRYVFDLAVFDEAHKTAGREGRNYAFALEDANLPIRKRLFLTATPRHYNPLRKDKEGDAQLVFSMDRPEVYGPQAFRLTFAEAARRGIICGYKVIISVITSEMVTNEFLSRSEVMVNGDAVLARQVANQIALRDAIEKYGVRKVFTFHRDVKSAQSFVSNGPEGVGTHLADVAADVRRLTSKCSQPSTIDSQPISESLVTSAATSGFQTFHVNGTMPTARREREMRDFRAAPRAVMSNARCLTEGVDVPAVDMVAFLSPRRSRVDIVQATGRAMRRSLGKTTGYVLVPLFVEQAVGESIEQAVSRATFDEVWAVLQSLQEQDDVLDDIIHQMQAERRLPKGFDDARFRERVEVLGPTVTLDNLRRAITTFCLDRLARPWDEMVQLLATFKKQHRHLRVPQEAPAPWTELGLWVDHVRALKRNGHLSIERQAQLDQIGFCWRVDGQTLDDSKGLLNETEFATVSGLTKMSDYRKRGLIIPVGYAMAGPGISPFYHPRQIIELMMKLGVTLKSTDGLLIEKQFKKASGLTKIGDYRKRGLIKPVGFAVTSAGISAFYHPRQIVVLRKALGVTLTNAKGLLNEAEFMTVSGLSQMAKYRKRNLVKPLGFAMTKGSRVSPFYHPRQIAELKKALGITLVDTKGLLNETEFMTASGLAMVADYRKRRLIKPVGFAITSAGISAFYHPRQIAELKKTLGITLTSTKGLFNETQIRKVFDLTQIEKYREQDLIRPVGVAMSASKLSRYYHPRQIVELKKELGITLKSTKGLLNENEFRKASGLTRVENYRKRGLIKPVGFALTNGGVCPFYHPRQIAELKKYLGITLKSIKGLLTGKQFAGKSGLTGIARYVKQGLIKPVGFAMSSTKISAFYHPRQIAELRKELGITLKSTRGLLTETEFRKVSGLTNIINYRKRGLIKPIGFSLMSGGISAFYHPNQIEQLKQALVARKRK